MTSNSCRSWMPARTGVGCDWDMKERVGAFSVTGRLGTGERAPGMAVIASAKRGTPEKGGRTAGDAAAHRVLSFSESNTV